MNVLFFVVGVAVGLGIFYVTGRGFYVYRQKPAPAIPKAIFVGTLIWAMVAIPLGLIIPLLQ